MLEEIIRLINYIGDLHREFSDDFFNGREKLNFKNFRVDHVINEESYDENFISLLHDYIDQLSFSQIFYTFESEHSKIETRFRGKTRESALNKLYRYRFEHKDPKTSIQKCVNDLLGFRIIVDSDLDYEQIKENIEKSKEKKVELFRPYIRFDNDYQALHILFKSGKNIYLPWELQIWKKADEVSNESSHKNHKEKRQYINWTEIYRENKHREG